MEQMEEGEGEKKTTHLIIRTTRIPALKSHRLLQLFPLKHIMVEYTQLQFN